MVAKYVAGACEGVRKDYRAFMQGEQAIERCAELGGWRDGAAMLDEMRLTLEEVLEAGYWFEVTDYPVACPQCFTVRPVKVVMYHSQYTNIVEVRARVLQDKIAYLTYQQWLDL